MDRRRRSRLAAAALPVVYGGLALLALRALPSGVLGHNWDWMIPATSDGLLHLRDRYASLWHDLGLGHPITVGASVLPFFELFTLPALLGIGGALLSRMVVFGALTVAATSAAAWVHQLCRDARLPAPGRGAFLGGLLFGFSPYLLCEIHGGGVTQLVSYAVFPLAPLTVERALAARGLRRELAVILVFTVLCCSLQRLVLAFAVSAVAAVLAHGWRPTLGLAARIALPFLALNLVWIAPLVADVGTLSEEAFGEATRFTEANLQHGVPGAADALVGRGYFRDFVTMGLGSGALLLMEVGLIGGLLPLVVLGGRLGAARAQRPLLALLLLATPFVTAALAPFGDTVLALYRNVAPLNLFRSPQHFLVLPTLAIAGLGGLGLAALAGRPRGWRIVPLILCALWWVPFTGGDLLSAELSRRHGGGNGLTVFTRPPALEEAVELLDAGDDDARVLVLPAAYSPFYLPRPWQAAGQGGDPLLNGLRRAAVTTDYPTLPAARVAIRALRDAILEAPADVVEKMRRLDIRYLLVRPDVAAHFDASEAPLDHYRHALPTVPGLTRRLARDGFEVWERDDPRRERVRLSRARTITVNGAEPGTPPARGVTVPARHHRGSSERVVGIVARPPFAGTDALLRRPGDADSPQVGDTSLEIVGSIADAGATIPSGRYRVDVEWTVADDVGRLAAMRALPGGRQSVLPRHLAALAWRPGVDVSLDLDGDGGGDLAFLASAPARPPRLERRRLPIVAAAPGSADPAVVLEQSDWRWRAHHDEPAIERRADGTFLLPVAADQYAVVATSLEPTALAEWRTVEVAHDSSPGAGVEVKLRLVVDFTGDADHDMKLIMEPLRRSADGLARFDVPSEILREYAGLDVGATRVLGLEVLVGGGGSSAGARAVAESRLRHVDTTLVSGAPSRFAIGGRPGFVLLGLGQPPGIVRPRLLSGTPLAEILAVDPRGALFLESGALVTATSSAPTVRRARPVDAERDRLTVASQGHVEALPTHRGWSVLATGSSTVDLRLRVAGPQPLTGPLRVNLVFHGSGRLAVSVLRAGGEPDGELEMVLCPALHLPIDLPLQDGETHLRLQPRDPEGAWSLQLAPGFLVTGVPTARQLSEILEISIPGATGIETRFESLTRARSRGLVEIGPADPRFPAPSAPRLVPETVRLLSGPPSVPDPAPSTTAAVTVERRAAHYRVVDVAPGAECDLILAERYAAGWRALLFDAATAVPDGFFAAVRSGSPELEHFPASGYENGWRLPDRSAPVRVALIYAPQASTMFGLRAGAVGFLLWWIGRGWTAWRRRS